MFTLSKKNGNNTREYQEIPQTTSLTHDQSYEIHKYNIFAQDIKNCYDYHILGNQMIRGESIHNTVLQFTSYTKELTLYILQLNTESIIEYNSLIKPILFG